MSYADPTAIELLKKIDDAIDVLNGAFRRVVARMFQAINADHRFSEGAMRAAGIVLDWQLDKMAVLHGQAIMLVMRDATPEQCEAIARRFEDVSAGRDESLAARLQRDAKRWTQEQATERGT